MASEPIHTEHNEAPAPLAVEQVGFCRKSDCPAPAEQKNDAHLDFYATGRVARYTNRFLIVMVVGVICIYIDRHWAIAPSIYLPIGALIVLAAIAYWVVRARRFAQRLNVDNVPESPPPDTRLQCVGAPSDLPEAANLESVPFEPHVYHVSFAAVLMMQAASIFWLLHTGLQYMRDANPLLMVLMGIIVVMCCVALIYRLRPVYYRISPGRLEVLRYGFISSKPVKVERYNLRKARIVADLLRNRVTIYESPESNRTCYLALMPDRKEAMLTFFLAAVSTYETPDLPEDAL